MKRKIIALLMLLTLLATPMRLRADECQDCIDNCLYIHSLSAAICATQYAIDAGICLIIPFGRVGCLADAAEALDDCLDAAQDELDGCLSTCCLG